MSKNGYIFTEARQNFPTFAIAARCINYFVMIFRCLSRLLFFVIICFTSNPYGFSNEVNDVDEARERYPYAELNQKEITFDSLKQGSVLAGTIVIKNEGARDLVIAQVRSSCGLMIQSWPTSPVQPGKEVSIHFRYDSQRLGAFERFITIHTNAWQKDIVVKIRGEVVPL